MGDASANEDIAALEEAFPLTKLDREILSQTDEEYKSHDWEELKRIIGRNDLDLFKRRPSDLRRYISWTRDIKAQYGSMSAFILANKLPQAWGQPPFTPASTIPFADPSDYKILINDWPYGMAPGIIHLVVWTRTPIATTPEKGDMTDESRALLKDFVQRQFIDPLGPGGENKIMWFKNWVALQSVRALEHFHVMVRDVDDETLERWTGDHPKRSPEGLQLSSE